MLLGFSDRWVLCSVFSSEITALLEPSAYVAEQLQIVVILKGITVFNGSSYW